jgi:hypothetical protein
MTPEDIQLRRQFRVLVVWAALMLAPIIYLELIP